MFLIGDNVLVTTFDGDRVPVTILNLKQSRNNIHYYVAFGHKGIEYEQWLPFERLIYTDDLSL